MFLWARLRLVKIRRIEGSKSDPIVLLVGSYGCVVKQLVELILRRCSRNPSHNGHVGTVVQPPVELVV